MEERRQLEVFKAQGVCSVLCGEIGSQNAIDYARQRAHSGLCDIQVLDEN
jgi:hypothetical protein